MAEGRKTPPILKAEGRKTPPILARSASIVNLVLGRGDADEERPGPSGSGDRARGDELVRQVEELAVDGGDEVDDDDNDELTQIYMNFTRNDPIGSTLLALVADNSNLCNKVGLRKCHTSIKELAKTFYLHTNAQRQVQNSAFERSVELVEQHLLEKELNLFMLNISYPPPTRFSNDPKLITATQKSEAIRIFPTKN
jgi:hypothetical protein